MSSPTKTIRIVGEDQRRYAHDVIDRIVAGGSRVWEIVVRPHEDRRSLDQNARFHAMIADIHRQAFRGYQFRCLKAVLVSQFAAEKEDLSEPLRYPGETTWDWARKTLVYVRPSTTDFTKKETADFIEWLYATGAEFGVQWSERAQSVYDEYKETA